MSLSGQTALVTGASRGLGRAIARRLAREGAAVWVNYVSRGSDADKVVEEIHSAGGRANAIRADIGDPTQVQDMMSRVMSEMGPLSILVNNAGLAIRGTLETFNPADLERMRRTNVDGLIHVTRAAIPGMQERRYGRIVNITSIAGHGTTLPGSTFYAATKAAVSTMTRRFAMELSPQGITVNAVAPGFILTDMVKEGRSADEYGKAAEEHQRPFDGRPRGGSGGYRACGSLPGFARIRIHHGSSDHCGWRPDGLHRPSLRRRATLALWSKLGKIGTHASEGTAFPPPTA